MLGRVPPLLLALILGACASSKPEPAGAPLPNASDAGSLDGSGAGVPRATCAPSAVPDDVRATFSLAPFYTQYVGLRGFPIVASAKTTPRALCVARDVIEKMLAHKPEIADRLGEKKIRLAIMAKTEVTTDIPEHSDLTPKEYWDQRARGLGATLARPAVSAGEENVLCMADDRYRGESILVHEFSHSVFDIGVELYEPSARSKLDAAYGAAMSAGRFPNTYAATNSNEYWAEGVQDWFDTNLERSPPDGVHNEINTRDELSSYDPALAELIAEVFGKLPWRYSCP